MHVSHFAFVKFVNKALLTHTGSGYGIICKTCNNC